MTETDTGMNGIVGTVLIVEDDTFLQEIIIARLSKKGYTTVATRDGKEVIALAERHKPDIIVLDLTLPGLPGEEVLVLLKSHDILKSVPVITFTNRSSDGDKEKLLALGASRHYIKAETDLGEFVHILSELIGESKK